MGYYIRVVGPRKQSISIEELQQVATPAVLSIEDTDEDGQWTQLVVKHSSGTEIASLERNDVVAGEFGHEELQEMISGLEHYKPHSAASWLKAYLPGVVVICAFQLLSGTDVEDGWPILDRVYAHVWKSAGGILQADMEGISNEAGYTILWQFRNDARGSWKVAVLQNGDWKNFEIELSNAAHREAFLRGEVPEGVQMI